MGHEKNSDHGLGDRARLIQKPDGTKVTVLPNGDVVVEKPDGDRITHFPDQTSLLETVDGNRILRKPRLPRVQQPLNVSSTAPEVIGKLMSNFAPTPFTLDGRRYACVEAFYVCLKFWDDPAMQAKVRRMDGREAKRAGSKQKATAVKYQRSEFLLGSPEHHELIKRAIRAKLEENSELAEAFVKTHPRPIIHDTGRAEDSATAFPAKEFTRIVTELRDELRKELIDRSAG